LEIVRGWRLERRDQELDNQFGGGLFGFWHCLDNRKSSLSTYIRYFYKLFFLYFSMKLGVKSILAMVLILVSVSLAFAVEPFGVENINVENSSKSTSDDPVGVPAQAGNVTELNIFGYSTTQAWQGYFGNVSGTIQLADSSDNIMYNWSVADPEGEIYATRQPSVSWESVDCFNWSENGSWLESDFNIAANDVDGVDETFNSYSHPVFYTNNLEIPQDTCMSTNVFDSTGGSTNNFYEVLLWDGVDVIFTSVLEEGSVLGFDGKDHDFEMLVLEDGHGTDTSTTPYYFYVELE